MDDDRVQHLPVTRPSSRATAAVPAEPIPAVLLQGTPFQRGYGHGSRFAAAVRAAVGRSCAACGRQARERAARSWRLLETAAPDVRAELEGLARGAGCDVADLSLHVGFEFALPGLPDGRAGCSTVAVEAREGVLVAQNWDGPAGSSADLVLFVHVGAGGFERAMVASVGTLGWVGCNNRGLAFVTNDVMLDASPLGLPSQVVRRLMLDGASVGEALATLDRLPHMSGRCYLLGDAAGGAAGVEISPSVGARAFARGAPLAHTNHALRGDMAAVEDEAALQKEYPSSRRRLDSLLAALPGASGLAGVKQVLRDREGAPDAVAKTLSAAEPTETAFSIIFDCAAGDLHLCSGPPHEGSYRVLNLGKPFPELRDPGEARTDRGHA